MRKFRFVFAAHVLSLLGGVVARVALPVLVYAGTSPPLLSALTFAMGFLPQALRGALLAPVAERFPPRAVLVGCDLACAAAVGAMMLPGMPVAGLLVLSPHGALLLAGGGFLASAAMVRLGTSPQPRGPRVRGERASVRGAP